MVGVGAFKPTLIRQIVVQHSLLVGGEKASGGVCEPNGKKYFERRESQFLTRSGDLLPTRKKQKDQSDTEVELNFNP